MEQKTTERESYSGDQGIGAVVSTEEGGCLPAAARSADDDDVEVARAVDAEDKRALDVAGAGRPRDRDGGTSPPTSATSGLARRSVAQRRPQLVGVDYSDMRRRQQRRDAPAPRAPTTTMLPGHLPARRAHP